MAGVIPVPLRNWTRDMIISPALNYKEADLLSDRTHKRGHQVFLSNLQYELSDSSRHGKYVLLKLVEPMDIDEDEDNDDELDHSPFIRGRSYAMWRSLNEEQKGWWTERADIVNRRHIPGILHRLVGWISDKDHIKQNIRKDFIAVRTIFRAMILYRREDVVDERVLECFKPEIPFRLGTQSYRKKIILRSFLIDVLLGKAPIFSKCGNNIVFRTDRRILLHIASRTRAKEFFDIGDLNVAEFFQRETQLSYAMCGKVQIRYNNGKEKLAYIVNEDADYWYICTVCNKDGRCDKVRFNRNNGTFNYQGIRGNITSTAAQSLFEVTFYWPIRIHIRFSSQHMSITANRMVYRTEGNAMMLDDRLST